MAWLYLCNIAFLNRYRLKVVVCFIAGLAFVVLLHIHTAAVCGGDILLIFGNVFSLSPRNSIGTKRFFSASKRHLSFSFRSVWD